MELKTKWLLSRSKSCSCTMSGVWRAVAFSKGCAVIFHSPLGCVHVASDMDMGSQYRIMSEGSREDMDAVPLISSNIREKDTIFGGVNRLHQCISYVMETYRPDCLFIASSCVAGVIGDDVEQEAEDAEMEYGIPVVSVAYAGFLGGGYSDGYYKTANKIVDQFFTEQKHIKGRVLLLGDQLGPWAQYALEVKRLLSLFGLTAEYQFPGYVPFNKWKNITDAEWIVMLGTGGKSGELHDLAEKIGVRYKIPVLTKKYPIGWENTKAWIREIGMRLGENDKTDGIIQEEEHRLDEYVKTIEHITKNKKAVIGIGRGSKWYDPADTIHSIKRLGMNLEGIIFYKNLSDEEKNIYSKKIKSYTDSPIYDESSGLTIMEQADILLTTNELLSIRTKQFFIPMMPMAGTNGEISILRTLYRILCRYGNKGGITYATV